MSLAPALLFLLATTASPTIWTLRVPGNVLEIRLADVDGDGDRDALVSVLRDEGVTLRREVHLFPRLSGGYGERAARVLDVPAEVVFLDAADLDGDGAAEILLLDPQGLSRCSLAGEGFSAPQRIVELQSFFRLADRSSVPFVDLAKDVDYDGRLDLLLPARDGYVFYRGQADGAPGQPHAVPAGNGHSIGKGRNIFYRVRSRLARPTPTDWDGDGEGDLVLAFEEQLTRWILGRSGTPRRGRQTIDLGPLMDAGSGGQGGLAMSSGKLMDVDGDRRCDLLLTRRLARPGLMAGVVTQSFLLLSKDLLHPSGPKPRQAIRTNGVTSPPRLFDLDGDGALDLILTTLRTDLLTKLRESLLEKVQVTFFVYRFDREQQRFGDEPIFSESLAMPAELLLEVGAYGWVTFKADYDGDGRPDLALYDADQEVLSIRRGIEKKGWFSDQPIAFEDDPFRRVRLSLSRPFFGEDIDGDGTWEIVSCRERDVVIVDLAR